MWHQSKIEQLERLRSEIPPTAPWLPILMIHIRSQVKTRQNKSKLQILKDYQNFKILQETLHVTHLLKLLNKMYKYEMDPTRTLGATERLGMWDGRTDRRTDWVKPIYLPTTLLCGGYKKYMCYSWCHSDNWCHHWGNDLVPSVQCHYQITSISVDQDLQHYDVQLSGHNELMSGQTDLVTPATGGGYIFSVWREAAACMIGAWKKNKYCDYLL